MTIGYLPSSIYVGGASGNLFPTFYVPASNTNSAGQLEGIGVVGSLTSSTAPYSAVLQFNLASTSTGALTLRALAMTTSTAVQNALFTVNDGVTAPGSSIAATSLTAETQATVAFNNSSDKLVETKVALTTNPSTNGVLTIRLDFNSTGLWTLASQSVWQFSLTQGL